MSAPSSTSYDLDFRRALDEMKLRVPIEDVVLERVPELKRRGSLWEACCPFHEERTPSFKVDPNRGTWHCFGSCAAGGDQISFLERFENVDFMEALEILSARSGIPIPRRSKDERGRDEDAPLLEVLAAAGRFYAEALEGPEGEAARGYLARRGLTPETARSFGIGWAPAAGEALVRRATERGVDFERLEAAGLARRNDRGRPYDFFRGRLMIPIADDRGRTVGFGARLLDDAADPRAPKYVNTPETRVFHKGRLVYALDRARQAARSAHRIALVEGYTDVMAAHQVGLGWVCAVLGTSTTEDHAALLRRTGARRIDLVFDGDAAGRKAAWRALAGLLPLGIELAVATLPEGCDPCDMLVAAGAAAGGEGSKVGPAADFERFLDAAPGWFDWVLAGMGGLDPAALAAAVDEALTLLELLPKPVEREARLAELARHLNIPLESLREQRRNHPATRARSRREAAVPHGRSSSPQAPDPRASRAGAPSRSAAPAGDPREAAATPHPDSDGQEAPARRELPRVSPRVLRAFDDLIGAVLADFGLVPLFRTYAPFCREPRLARIAQAILAVADRDEDPSLPAVLTELADDPVRERVAALCVRAQHAESPRLLFDGGVAALRELAEASALAKLQAELRELEQLPTRDEVQTRRVRELELRILELVRQRSHRRAEGLRAG